jgi:signal transduction histidine kinase
MGKDTTETSPLRGSRILIVDDDALVIESFERILGSSGNSFTLEKTTDSTRALEMIQEHTYDIVITDLVMPNVDGIQVLRRVKELHPDSEVILITAYSSYNTAVDAMYFGAFDYISKPINTSELKFRIKRALEKRRAVLERESKIREMERLFYTLSHDFKATILSVRSFVEILYREHLEKQKNEDALFLARRITANVEIMESIMDGLLAYSKIGKVEEDWENIDTEEMLREITENFLPALKNNDIELVVDGPLPEVHFYRSGLRNVLSNLIDNAVKYARSDRNSYIRIGTIPDPDPDFHHFYIEDNGIGIDPENLDLIFELFQRQSSSLHVEGYGMGLAIVKKILETSHGSIRAESEKEGKTIFRFTLPRVLEDPGVQGG